MSRYARRPSRAAYQGDDYASDYRQSDHRQATLEKIARLRETIYHLQDDGAGFDAPAYEPPRTRRPAERPAAAPRAFDEPRRAPSPRRSTFDDDAVRTALAPRRPAPVAGHVPAMATQKLEADLDAMRRQLADLTGLLTENDTRRADTGAEDRFAARVQTQLGTLRQDVMDRIEAGLGHVENHLGEQRRDVRRSSDGIEAALRELTQRFDSETTDLRGAVGQELADQRDAMTETMSEGFGAVAEGLAARIGAAFEKAHDGAARREDAHLQDARRIYTEITDALERLTSAEAVPDPRAAEQIDELGHRVSELTDHIAQIGRAVNDAPVLRRLETQVRELASGGLQADSAVLDRIASLADTQERLIPLLEKAVPGNSALDRFESVLNRQSEAMERFGERDDGATAERLDACLAQLDALTTRLDAMPQTAGAQAVQFDADALVGRIEAGVAASLDAEGLRTVEQAVADLDKKLDALAARPVPSAPAAPAVDVSETVALANQAVTELLETQLQGTNDAMTATLRQGLEELRAAQSSDSGRTQATLTALHDVLERAFMRVEQEPLDPAAGSFDPAPPPAQGAPVPVAESFVPARPAQPIPAAAPVDAFDAPLTDDDWAPVDPQQGEDEMSAFQNSPSWSDAETPTDFIAQARAAAQAASAEAHHHADAPTAANASGIRSLFKGRQMTAETASSVDAAPAASSRLRPLIMAAAAAMLVIGAVAVFAIAVEPAPEEPLTATPMTIAPDTPRQMTSTVSPLDSATADPASLSVDDPVANAVRVVDVPDVGTDDQFSQIDPLLNPTPVMGDALTGAGTPDADLMASMADTLGPLVLREAAASGDAKAQFEIGERLMSNRFGEADPAAAKAWFERAAAQDLAPAQYRLASLHEKGTGTAQDPVLARTWYERAAGQGNARAMHNLGVLYAEGAFGEADFVNAVTWFEQGARHGVPDSQFNLGIIYGRGLGVAQDLAGAYMWFDVAGRKGDQDAIAKRDEVAAVMTPEQLADGKARSADLVLTTPTEAANAVTLPSEMIGDVAALQTPAEQAPAALPAAPREVVRQVQQLLALRGYDPGPADGLTGQRTANAVAGFQNDAGLPVTGVITPDLVSALIAS